jgi:uncharacterized protein (TIGR02145 family)
MKITTLFFAIAVFVLPMKSFGQTEQFTDSRTGFEYMAVKIGNQTWMAENLQVYSFRNGDTIQLANTEEKWAKATEEGQPAYSYIVYDEDDALLSVYYNWFAVTDPRGLAPQGWHIPASAEWKMLATQLGGPAVTMEKLKSEYYWTTGTEGTNESGFEGYPMGKITADGYLEDEDFYGYFWSSSESEGFGINFNLDEDNSSFEEAQAFKGNGFSVRCVKD